FLLPQNVPANEFLNLEGRKLSTSRNWAVWVHEYLERWPDRQDELRYCLGTILPEFRDSEFTWKDFQDKNNNELVAILGNFVQRVFVLSHKYYEGRSPEPGTPDALDRELWSAVHAQVEEVARHVDHFRFREALAAAMNVARAGNKYLTDTEPWKLQKTDPDRVRTVLSNGLNVTAVLSIVLEPFLPFTAAKLRGMLGIGGMDWDDVFRTDLIGGGAELGQPQHLFRPITDAEIQPEIERLHANMPVEQTKPTAKEDSAPSKKDKSNIAFDDFAKLDLRAGRITAAEAVPKADKLLKLTVDVGEAEPRTVVSGIAQHYDP
ncbi:MAG: class I tRNA ligase family protein, partial [Flavobacteriales bacterium]|nr:class I tRNA ligase family protein [Flavobacteriales bacterium]